ncbi:hypothetical protein RRG08_004743 [Elysia crispata]|uniref:Uncharacterized protein n=1 Tax=Elysia crispata TaxID=231223 RepID=A0AAE1AIU2_9GAST|nr:hypothetical protein RRG08_004743 [Elysia crispata]
MEAVNSTFKPDQDAEGEETRQLWKVLREADSDLISTPSNSCLFQASVGKPFQDFDLARQTEAYRLPIIITNLLQQLSRKVEDFTNGLKERCLLENHDYTMEEIRLLLFRGPAAESLTCICLLMESGALEIVAFKNDLLNNSLKSGAPRPVPRQICTCQLKKCFYSRLLETMTS